MWHSPRFVDSRVPVSALSDHFMNQRHNRRPGRLTADPVRLTAFPPYSLARPRRAALTRSSRDVPTPGVARAARAASRASASE